MISKVLTLQNHEPEIQETVVDAESSVTCECCSTRYVDEQAHEDKKDIKGNDNSNFC